MQKLAIIGMQKNEKELLGLWADYYARLVTYSSIFIIDNGSSCSETKIILNALGQKGAHIIYRPDPRDFERKGELCLLIAKELLRDGYDFVYFADADEFLVLNKENHPVNLDKMSLQKILKELSSSGKSLFRISVGWLNIPRTGAAFIDEVWTQKLMLKKNFPDDFELDVGFHVYDWAKRKDIEKYGFFQNTPFGILHFHNKPYTRFIASAREKLKYRVDLNNLRALQNYNGPGVHLIRKMIMSENDYYDSFKALGTASVTVDHIFENLELNFPFQ